MNHAKSKARAGGLSVRALTSLSLACAGVWLVPSGIALHFAGEGESAMLTHLFMSLHNTAAVVFLLVGTAHLWLNRRAFGQYVRAKLSGATRVRREVILAALGVSALVGLVAAHGLQNR